MRFLLSIVAAAMLVHALASAATLDANSGACEVYNGFKTAMCKCGPVCITRDVDSDRWYWIQGVIECVQYFRIMINESHFEIYLVKKF